MFTGEQETRCLSYRVTAVNQRQNLWFDEVDQGLQFLKESKTNRDISPGLYKEEKWRLAAASLTYCISRDHPGEVRRSLGSYAHKTNSETKWGKTCKTIKEKQEKPNENTTRDEKAWNHKLQH